MRLAGTLLIAPLVRAAAPRTRPVRDGWLLAVLPASCRRAHATGATLAAALRDAGLAVVDGPLTASPDVDALVADCPSPAAAIRFCQATAASGVPLVVVAVCGGRPWPRERSPRLRRALELAAMPPAAGRAFVAARRVAGVLARAGRRVEVVPTGDRSRGQVFGSGGRLRPPVGAVVSGSRGERGRTLLDEALAGASAATGRSLHVVSATMTDSGKLLARVADDRRQQRFLLRVAGGSSGALIESAAASTRLLSAPAVAPAVRERVVAPLAVGAVGGVRYALEAEAAGRHPRRMTGALWDDCLEFLVALHAADGHPAPDADGVRAIVADDVRLVAPALEARGLERLQRLADGLAERLAAVPLGWAHGDFWPQNLLVRSQRLTAVIDWDDAAAGRLPLLDLLDLRGVSDPGTRRLTPGPRLERVLLPLARRAGDEPIHRYCAATGIPAEPELLEALVLGWWLQRVAHDLRDCPDKLARPRWLEDNVAAPLAVLAAR